jgi:hypothetical protein
LANECRLQWQNRQTPLLNWSEPDKSELAKLVELAEKHNMHDWSTIASELGTRRAPWLAMRHYFKRPTPDTPWTASEDELLESGVKQFGNDWYRVALLVRTRSSAQCLQRWHKSKNPTIRRARWLPDEDTRLRIAVQHYGVGKWALISRHITSNTTAWARRTRFFVRNTL